MNRPQTIDHAAELRQIEKLARLLDSRFSLFGIRFGYDSLLGLIPGVGDVVTAAPSAWLVWKAHKLGVSRSALTRMAGNWALDFGIGSVPLIGDLFDLGFKANLRNADILRSELERMAAATAPQTTHL